MYKMANEKKITKKSFPPCNEGMCPSIQNNYFSFRNTYKMIHQIKKIFYQILNSKRITHVPYTFEI